MFPEPGQAGARRFLSQREHPGSSHALSVLLAVPHPPTDMRRRHASGYRSGGSRSRSRIASPSSGITVSAPLSRGGSAATGCPRPARSAFA